MEVFSTKCPTCNAKIPFDPKTQKWVCDYCGGSFTAEQIKSFEEAAKANQDTEENKEYANATHNYDVEIKNQATEDESSGEYNDDLDLYTCNNCGAQIVADKNTSATFCVYCGGYTLIKDRLTGHFKPQYIIPFQTTKEDAKEEYIKYIKSRTFVPNKFKSAENIEKITGVYIPFWTYDADIRIKKTGTGTKVRTWISGNYEYTEYSDYQFVRDLIESFDDVPVDGSEKFNDDLMDSIEPFDYTKKQPFDPRYLSGFLAEKYDVDKNKAYVRAQLRMVNTTNKAVDTSISYSSFNVASSDVSEDKGEVLYWLLPVWMLNTKYNDKMYQFAMNGESKKVVGNFPIDNKKVFKMTAAIFAIVFAILYLIDSGYRWSNYNNDTYNFFTGPVVIGAIVCIALLIFFHKKFISNPKKMMGGKE